MRYLSGLLLFLSLPCWADGMVVDKVYHPYVLPYEKELEWRLVSHQSDAGNVLAQRIGGGGAISETLSVELYAVGERDDNGDFGLAAYETELRWQVVEQGRYWADLGALFEVEKSHRQNAYEFTTGLLFEKEFGSTSLTLNAFAVYEWGADIDSEWESEFRGQYRYRWRAAFQPAIELYSGEDFIGIGPGFIGLHRFAGQRQLKWEAGFITEVGHGGKDHSVRLALEFEF
ncbi:hypothetical protein [Pseudoalteromonas ruthenica]|uniref:Uncharacterized protein n=1 Tax=Pseudoalteromonas ruthenica TaxID=151081 RepID=A0A0F4PK87_9GAMM|nr:hypothetical protein [Pseudoalteromonas ruthenica]KJY95822.1 hypothetical protein TW76_14795 [Pseudoalteromonas ruthenica]KJZ00291.1 hypothetical protein TW72_06155 [Pseudoalteromonas ruthenica]TMO86079.1 hypothetical protein CWC12_14955 [Pseudoalteromonas ruthenica]TMO90746.1 hypothetical protein CWC13_17915 [Pseudoalteromonas ruthenica]TMP00983.1 hypothetical protein CWC07_01285 [Pseudoalteromonas ruthenica]